jgi:hypothetical protein
MTADAASCANPVDVAIDRAVDELERELGHLDTIRRIAVERVLRAFGADWQRVTRGQCGFEGCPYADWC